jgi:probable phosphoglycerate mutase
MTTFLLIRHGDTDAVNHYIAGTAPGTPLNERGRAQVRQLAERLRSVTLAAIVSSPLERCRVTAEVIAKDRNVPITIEPALTEFEFGDWTGRTFRELDPDPMWQRFNAVRSLARAPHGEMMIEVQQRAVAALSALAASHPNGTVAVISHGDVIRSVLMLVLGMPLEGVHRLEVSPAGITCIAWDENAPVVRGMNGDRVPERV